MSDKNDALGDRMKGYENVSRYYLPKRSYTVIRIDGKAFTTFTKHCQRPFDEPLMKAMQQTAIKLCENIENAVMSVTHSDEISLISHDLKSIRTEPWFGNNIQKIGSVSASMAAAFFNSFYQGPKLAFFDARVFTIPDREEVLNYLIWRQQDATRNALQMIAQSLYSHKALQGKKFSDLNELLFQKDINFNDVDSIKKRGALISKKYFERDVLNPQKGEMEKSLRSQWTIEKETLLFTSAPGRVYLRSLIPERGYAT